VVTRVFSFVIYVYNTQHHHHYHNSWASEARIADLVLQGPILGGWRLWSHYQWCSQVCLGRPGGLLQPEGVSRYGELRHTRGHL